MLQLEKSTCRWWQKPLVNLSGKLLPAELVVLNRELQDGEKGVWLNSRGTTSGVVDLLSLPNEKFKTVRIELPELISHALSSLYKTTGLYKGIPDLVIWNEVSMSIRFVEVKCPHWDFLSKEQNYFINAANKQGIATSIVEWEFV
jgi:hypothetical protein